MQQQLGAISQAIAPAQMPSPGLCNPNRPAASSVTQPSGTDVSFPDSGFPSTSDHQLAQEDSLLSSGTADSLKTVRALSPVHGPDSADCSLLEQYLSSVQQREEEAEEGLSDRTETPQPSTPGSPSKTAPTSSPTQKSIETAPESV